MTGDDRTFPIRLDDHIRTIPWAMLEPHEPQAHRNHSQSLVRLAARGGLTPEEAVAILEDRPYERMPMTTATLILKSFVSAWTTRETLRDGWAIPPASISAELKVRFDKGVLEGRVCAGIALLERMRDGRTPPHRGLYNELIAILEACK